MLRDATSYFSKFTEQWFQVQTTLSNKTPLPVLNNILTVCLYDIQDFASPHKLCDVGLLGKTVLVLYVYKTDLEFQKM